MNLPKAGSNPDHETESHGSDTIFTRLLTIAAIAAICVWANHEASKGFQISITNSISDPASARRFHRLLIADDTITRMVLSSSLTAETILYPLPSYQKKRVNCIRINFQSSSAEHRQQDDVLVRYNDFSSDLCCSYTIFLSNNILREGEALEVVKREVGTAIKKVTAYAWLYDGEGSAPNSLREGISEYIAGAEAKLPEIDDMGKDKWWLSANPEKVAAFIQYCECVHSGFTARLNSAMAIRRWHSGMVDEAVGLPGVSSSSRWFSFSSILTLRNQTSGMSCRWKEQDYNLAKRSDEVDSLI